MARITKAQKGRTVSKDSVPSEMFPGKMIPKSKSNYATGRMAKAMDEAKKPAAPKKKLKEGGSVKKAQVGVSLRSGQFKRIGRLAAKNPDKAKKVASRMVERDTRKARGKEYVSKNLSSLLPAAKKGASVKKCKYGCK